MSDKDIVLAAFVVATLAAILVALIVWAVNGMLLT